MWFKICLYFETALKLNCLFHSFHPGAHHPLPNNHWLTDNDKFDMSDCLQETFYWYFVVNVKYSPICWKGCLSFECVKPFSIKIISSYQTFLLIWNVTGGPCILLHRIKNNEADHFWYQKILDCWPKNRYHVVMRLVIYILSHRRTERMIPTLLMLGYQSVQPSSEYGRLKTCVLTQQPCWNLLCSAGLSGWPHPLSDVTADILTPGHLLCNNKDDSTAC